MRSTNIIGPMIAKLRYQRGWRQDDLVAKMQLSGCLITRDVIASIETRRSPVTDRQIESVCRVFAVPVQELFPRRPRLNASTNAIGIATDRFLQIMFFRVTTNDQCAWIPLDKGKPGLLITGVVKGGVTDKAGVYRSLVTTSS